MRLVHRLLPALTVACVLPLPAGRSGSPDLTEAVRERLRARLEAVDATDLEVRGEHVHAAEALPAFYLARVYAPGWIDDRGVTPAADRLVEALERAGDEGLRVEDYHLAAIRAALADARRRMAEGISDPRRLADLDLLLTDAFMIYGAHLLAGRVDPASIDPEWHASRRGMAFPALLESALETGRVRETLDGLLPPQAGYRRLRAALARYRGIARVGGWQALAAGPAVSEGMEDERVPMLRSRLALIGDLPESSASGSGGARTFDPALAEALRQFQRRHGLAASGRLDSVTVAALNIPVDERIAQLVRNLERWRWLPQDLGDRHILVNIAGFELDLVDAGRPVRTMRVMVGRPYRRTPVFTGSMTYLVLSPYWHVPRNIAVQDKLPLIRRDPAYLARQRLRVFRGWGADAQEVDPATIDWAAVTAQNFDLRLRQDPGPLNALGRVKFMFPNRFNVYLHDTPSRELFDRVQRDFSSGCIRVEDPMALADWLLAGDARWTPEITRRVAAGGVETTVPLARPVPVHILYWTAWADDDGTIQFRPDVYRRDARLSAALATAPPGEE